MPGIVSHHVLVLAGMGVLWWARITTARPPRSARMNHRLARLLSRLGQVDGGEPGGRPPATPVTSLPATGVCRDCGRPLTESHRCGLDEWDSL